MAIVTYGKYYLWQDYGKCNYGKCIMANINEAFLVLKCLWLQQKIRVSPRRFDNLKLTQSGKFTKLFNSRQVSAWYYQYPQSKTFRS